MGAELQHWIEWKERCALELCCEESREVLRSYAESKFAWYVENLAANNTGMSAADMVGNAGDCWHLLEAHITLGVGCDGKSLKKWLFARVGTSDDPALQVIRGGARVVMRDAVRRFMHAELPEKDFVSIDSNVDSGGDSNVTLNQLLPGRSQTRAEVELRELQDAAAGMAENFFEGLDHAQRVVLLTKSLSISLADSAVVVAAGKGKSMLSRIWRSTIAALGSQIEEHYPAEDSDWKMELAAWTLEYTNNKIFFWSRVENRCAKLLELMER